MFVDGMVEFPVGRRMYKNANAIVVVDHVSKNELCLVPGELQCKNNGKLITHNRFVCSISFLRIIGLNYKESSGLSYELSICMLSQEFAQSSPSCVFCGELGMGAFGWTPFLFHTADRWRHAWRN